MIIKGDQVKGQISMTFGAIGKIFEGRFLNAMHYPVLAWNQNAFCCPSSLRRLEVKQSMRKLRAENFAKKSNEKPEVATMMKEPESITVKYVSLIIAPKCLDKISGEFHG